MKKILFVCGSLEPGCDGVGDYTRELAGTLKKIKLDVKIISIRDRHVVNIAEEEQTARTESVEVLRLSKLLSPRKRKKEFDRLVADYKPDLVSLQYVPYAFSSKGIPFGLPQFLSIQDNNIKWHFMIHESYIDGNRNFKDKLIRKAQITIIKNLKKKLNPAIINTSTPQYRGLLKAIGVESQILGLFGNIPIAEKVQKANSDEIFRGVYFGASPNFENIQAFIPPLKRLMKETNAKVEIVLCGRSSENGKRFASLLRSGVDSDRFSVVEKGEMSPDSLSRLFLSANFGIARIPPQLLGKSGSAIALLEHGLPLWVPLAKSQVEIAAVFDFRVDQCCIDLMDIKNSNLKFEMMSRLEEISTNFKNQFWTKEGIAGNV